MRQLPRFRAALEKIVEKGGRLKHWDMCKVCYETVCDEDCPAATAAEALGLPFRREPDGHYLVAPKGVDPGSGEIL